MIRRRHELVLAAGTSLLIVFGLAACAHGGRPEAMSAAEHRSEADAHEEKARRHAAVSGPATDGAPATDPIERPDRDFGSEFRWPTLVYNPAGRHDSAGERHLRHAAAHRKAAAALEAFEEAECVGFPPTTRSSCPFTGGLKSVTEIDKGVRLLLVDDANAEAVVEHLGCHYAFGRTRSFEGMAGCPLYLPGLSVALGPDGRSVEIVAETATDMRELRSRASTLTRD